MQLKNKPSFRQTLTTATCTLLGTTAADDALATPIESKWEFDSAFLYYSEDERVDAFEPVFKARKEVGDDEFYNFRLVVDVLTGASASGAVPMPFRQTFTSPSGNKTYSTPANETPLDPTFKDTRVALNFEWEKPINSDLSAVYGANFSREYDYTSLGASATYSKEINDKLTTLTGGVSFSYDLVDPVGGVPVGMTPMPDYEPGNNVKQLEDDSDNKTVIDLLFGVTQVIDRKTLLQLNYTIGSNSGYLTDPYKILSIIDDSTGRLVSENPADGIPAYRYEARPDSRLSQSVYLKYVHQFEEDVLNVSYRYFWDDWGIDSHTIDFRYRFELGGGHYLQPHLRYYSQSAADFYEPYLLDSNDDTIKEASADYRLGELTSTTVGMLYGVEFSKTHEFTIRAEMMTQSGDEPEKFGALQQQELFPNVDAMIIQIGYTFQF